MIPRRTYRPGVELSVVAMGGMTVVGLPQAEADRLVASSIERGVNCFDAAPTYGNGEAEEKLGLALASRRGEVFLGCKTTCRDAAGARRELEQSLKRLRTDRLDLYQFHGVPDAEQARRILGPRGAAETMMSARQKGLVRFIGFSAHSEEAALLLMDAVKFDSVMFPVNFACWARGFGARVVERAQKDGLALLALKALALQKWQSGDDRSRRPKCWYRPVEDRALALQAMRFALGVGAVSLVPPGETPLYEMALDLAAEAVRPLAEAEREALLSSAASLEPVFSSQQ
jgi:aryl-alcohol dehydrogenase-like predicted oxidoreductase